jgi:hypothetical protein
MTPTLTPYVPRRAELSRADTFFLAFTFGSLPHTGADHRPTITSIPDKISSN